MALVNVFIPRQPLYLMISSKIKRPCVLETREEVYTFEEEESQDE